MQSQRFRRNGKRISFVLFHEKLRISLIGGFGFKKGSLGADHACFSPRIGQAVSFRRDENDLYDITHHHFFFNDTATTEIYTLSLHDALPISEIDLGPLGHPPIALEHVRRPEIGRAHV